MDISIKCKYDDLISPKSLKPHPKNRNKHPADQIDRLAKLIEYQGVRAPIVISKLSGNIVKGHGTLMALNKLKLKKVPVVYQEFDNEDQEYAFVQSDNAIASWAGLDFASINIDLENINGSEFDLDMLGIRNFALNAIDKIDPAKEWQGMPEFNQADKTSYRHIVVHFDTPEDAENFFKAIGYKDTGLTRSIWYPPKENMDTNTRRYE